MARAEDEQVESLRSGAERVLVVVRDLDDRVPRADLADLLVLPGETGAVEDEVDLLRACVPVRRRRQLAGVDADTVDAHASRACGVAEPLPRRSHRAFLAA